MGMNVFGYEYVQVNVCVLKHMRIHLNFTGNTVNGIST